ALLGGAPALAQPLRFPEGGTVPPLGAGGTYLRSPESPEAIPGCGCNVHCVPEPYIKEIKKVVYNSGCETRCLCYYHGLSLFRRCGCDNGHCEHPICVRYLIKKTQICPEERTRCVPQEAPCCASDPCCGGYPAGTVMMPAAPPPTMPMT